MTTTNFHTALIELQEKLFHYALSLTSDEESAQDLLQETFLKALTYRDKFKDDTNLKAWMYTIMKNSFINNYRRGIKEKTTFEQNNSDYHMTISKDNVFASPESKYNAQEITQNINALDEEYRLPFTMFLEGYKYKEISDELSLPLGTVKSRIFFTRKKLEKSLVDYLD